MLDVGVINLPLNTKALIPGQLRYLDSWTGQTGK